MSYAMGRWRRRILTGGMLLAGGTLFSLGIAWVCVLNPWRAELERMPLELEPQLAWWREVAPAGMPPPKLAGRSELPGVTHDYLRSGFRSATNLRAGTQVGEEVMRIQAGLPLRSFQGEFIVHVRPLPDGASETLYRTAIRPPRWLMTKHIIAQRALLPWKPIWPGFVLNTLFYAGMLWLAFAGSRMIRQRRRIARGLCAHCAYPVGTSEVCTECGGVVAPKRVSRGSGPSSASRA